MTAIPSIASCYRAEYLSIPVHQHSVFMAAAIQLTLGLMMMIDYELPEWLKQGVPDNSMSGIRS